jgi:hypothetical protein
VFIWRFFCVELSRGIARVAAAYRSLFGIDIEIHFRNRSNNHISTTTTTTRILIFTIVAQSGFRRCAAAAAERCHGDVVGRYAR